jgi:allantoin racemase
MSQGPLGPREVARRQDILQSWAAPDVEITVRECQQGPASIESAYEEYLSVPGLAAVLTELEEQSQADAAIVGCFGDPGLDALYEVTSSMPVVGPGEASMHLACMLGRPFGIITVADGVVGPRGEARCAGGEPRPRRPGRRRRAGRFRMRHSKAAYPAPRKLIAGSRLSSLLVGGAG